MLIISGSTQSKKRKNFKTRENKRSQKPKKPRQLQDESRIRHFPKPAQYNIKNEINRFLDYSNDEDLGSAKTISEWKKKYNFTRKAKVDRMLLTWKRDLKIKSGYLQNHFVRATKKDDQHQSNEQAKLSGNAISTPRPIITDQSRRYHETGFRRGNTSQTDINSKVKSRLIDDLACSSEIEECMRLLGKDCTPTKEVQADEIRRRNQIYGVKKPFEDNVVVGDQPQHSFFNQRKKLPKFRIEEAGLQIPGTKGEDPVIEFESSVVGSKSKLPVVRGSLDFLKHMDQTHDFLKGGRGLGKK